MKKMHKRLSAILLLLGLVTSLCPMAAVAAAVVPPPTITKPPQISIAKTSFDSSDATLKFSNNDTSLKDKMVKNGDIHLTGYETNTQVGGVFLMKKLSQKAGEKAGFSVAFQMYMGNISNHNDTTGRNPPGDGFVFVVSQDTNEVQGLGQGIGYEGIKKSIGIEFDTYPNKLNFDTVPHVALNKDGFITEDDAADITNLKGSIGRVEKAILYIWVDYDANNEKLYYRVSKTDKRADASTISWDVDLAEYASTEYYIGFTAATGWSRQEHILKQLLADNQYHEDGLDFNTSYNDDNIAPSTPSITYKPEDNTCMLDGSVDNVGGSGLRGYEYSTDNGKTWQTYPDKAVAVGDAPSILARGIDNAGNIGGISAVYRVEATGVSGITDYGISASADGAIYPWYYAAENSPLYLRASLDAGYSFLGWYGDVAHTPPATGSGLVTSIAVKPSTTTTVYYPKAERKTYLVTASATSGGTNQASATSADAWSSTANILHGDTAYFRAKPTSGYSFHGWSDGSAVTAPATPGADGFYTLEIPSIAAPRTMHALFYNDSAVSFDANGGTPVSEAVLSEGGSIDLGTKTSTKAGNKFAGWKVTQGSVKTADTSYGSGKIVPQNAVLVYDTENPTGSAVLEAQWTRDDSCIYRVGEYGYKSINDAVAAHPATNDAPVTITLIEDDTIDSSDPAQVLPPLYTLIGEDDTIRLTLATGGSLTVGDDADCSNDDQNRSWNTGANVAVLELVLKDGKLQIDGQKSTIATPIILYPGKQPTFLTDANTRNYFLLTLVDNAGEPITSLGGGWSAEAAVAVNDGNDGDNSSKDGADTNFNLYGGRVKITNNNIAQYTDDADAFKLKLLAVPDVRAIRIPHKLVTNGDYTDPKLIFDYKSLDKALADTESYLDGSNDNEVYMVDDATLSETIFKGDVNNKTVSLIGGERSGAGNEITVNTISRSLKGTLSVAAGSTLALDHVRFDGTAKLMVDVTNSNSYGMLALKKNDSVTQENGFTLDIADFTKAGTYPIIKDVDSDIAERFTLTGENASHLYSLRYNSTSQTLDLVVAEPRSITYHADGGTGGMLPTDTNKYMAGDKLILPTSGGLEKAGFVFGGWLCDGRTYQPGDTFTVPSKGSDLTATWIPVDLVSREITNGTGDGATPDGYDASGLEDAVDNLGAGAPTLSAGETLAVNLQLRVTDAITPPPLDQTEIEKLFPTAKWDMKYVDLSLFKFFTVNDLKGNDIKITKADNLITVTIPTPKGTDNLKLTRRHDAGAAEEIKQGEPNKNAAGEYWESSATPNSIVAHLKLFSTYALVYPKATGGGGGGGGTTRYSVIVTPSNGGTISASHTTADAGTQITLSVTPAPNYRLAYVTAKGGAGNTVLLTEQNASSYRFTMPNQSVNVTAKFVRIPADIGKTGVSSVLQTDEHMSYINGYPDGTVGPLHSMSRAEVAQMFYNLLRDQNSTATAQFADVPSDMWCAKAVNTLAERGIVLGATPQSFMPNAAITREQFVAMAVRFASSAPDEKDASFPDVAKDRWSYDAIAIATGFGWIVGDDDGRFNPAGKITRAEVITIVNRMLGRAADRAFVEANQSALRQFLDLNSTAWHYYDLLEASNAHSTEGGPNEIWKSLRAQDSK